MLPFEVTASVLSGLVRIILWPLSVIRRALTLPWVLITDNIQMSNAIHDLVGVQVPGVFPKLLRRSAGSLCWTAQCICRLSALDTPPGIAGRTALSLGWTNLPHQISAPLPVCLSVSISQLDSDELTLLLLFVLVLQVCLRIF